MPAYKFTLLVCVSAVFFHSCKNANSGSTYRKISGHVPGTFRNLEDPAFTKNEDTVYYKDKRFSGYITGLYPNKDTCLVMGYLNGLQEGYTRKWYPGKKLMEERFYIQGGKEGTHKGWWENGKPKFVYHFANDEFEGQVTEWFSSGKLFRVFNEKMWWDNGAIRANYVIVNGEKFGLSGQKLCINKNLNQKK
jgi:antitoxin component YwqK of YwqJK toxin-antitoxin module